MPPTEAVNRRIPYPPLDHTRGGLGTSRVRRVTPARRSRDSACICGRRAAGLGGDGFRPLSPEPGATPPDMVSAANPSEKPVGPTEVLAAPGSPVASVWLKDRRDANSAGLMFPVCHPIVGVQTGSPRLEPRQVASWTLRLTHGLPRPSPSDGVGAISRYRRPAAGSVANALWGSRPCPSAMAPAGR